MINKDPVTFVNILRLMTNITWGYLSISMVPWMAKFFFIQHFIFNVTRYLYGTPTFEVTPVTIQYSHPPHSYS